MKKVTLLQSQINRLVNLPETGMGYQKIKLVLKNGEVKRNMTVLNSEFLVLENNQSIDPEEIEKIELEKV